MGKVVATIEEEDPAAAAVESVRHGSPINHNHHLPNSAQVHLAGGGCAATNSSCSPTTTITTRQTTTKSTNSTVSSTNTATNTTKSYLTNLLGRSSILLHSLKQQYSHMQQQQHQQQHQHQQQAARQSSGESTGSQATPTTSQQQPPPVPPSPVAKSRRHAIQEQSLERDAALSLKVHQDQLKHKRTSSIKGALRHAHLGALTRSATSDKRGGPRELDSGDSQLAKSMPYALFELPVTQRTFQRTRRRGAMLADPKRQLSADTIGLRQLTDEYLHNAGVVSLHSSANGTLVKLSGATRSEAGSATAPLGVSVGGGGGTGDPAEFPLQSQLYQATSEHHGRDIHHHFTLDDANSSSMSADDDNTTCFQVLPGSLPWQRDVCVQCELLRAPSQVEPYETTGDILDTIAGPFRGTCSNQQQQHQQAHSSSSFESNQLSATLKRGLTAISQHHLSPVAAPGAAGVALNAVVGNLKKSLSNTLDISRQVAAAQHNLHSQDSLPAYSSLRNELEPDDHDYESTTGGASNELQVMDSSGGASLIGQLTSKLSMQPSKKFSVSRKGLQRALSFDCRGYKRLEGAAAAAAAQQRQQQQQQQHQQSSKDSTSSSVSSRNLLSAKQATHNRSTLGLNSDQSPRPYLPQSASQVDFQLPLLPYHKMQEAIVSNRRLDRTCEPAPEPQPPAQKPLEADEMLCTQPESLDLATPVEPQRLMPQQDAKEQQDSQAGGGHLLDRNNKLPPPPVLVLDIPTIATPTSDPSNADRCSHLADEQQMSDKDNDNRQARSESLGVEVVYDGEDDDDDDGGEEVCANPSDDHHLVMASLLPGDGGGFASPGMSNSPSFCLEPQLNGSAPNQQSNNNLLTASDVFSRSKIKRPSTMVTSDAMNQVAQALHSSSSSNRSSAPAPSPGVSGDEQVVLRNRRSAIVPPKLTTDASSPDNEPAEEGKLVDVDDDNDEDRLQVNDNGTPAERRHSTTSLAADQEEVRLLTLRRKRSGGPAVEQPMQRPSISSHHQQRLGGSQTNLPTFYIEATDQPTTSEQVSHVGGSRQTPDLATSSAQHRPDSQMTNVDSIASSSSSANLSLSGKRGEFTVTSPGGLTVSFGSSRGRRRSSIAVIPQMQICPGDLLVYSKQLIDRMNQSDEPEPQQFLTIDDKKGKNIWSSFKLCAQFDNRTIKARNELLCSLEDVLASLQPSTFVDEQLSHYKGMLWNEFLYETESRRSASTEALAAPEDRQPQWSATVGTAGGAVAELGELQLLEDGNLQLAGGTDSSQPPANSRAHKPATRTASVKALMAAAEVASSLTGAAPATSAAASALAGFATTVRDPIKQSMSSGPHSNSNAGSQQPQQQQQVTTPQHRTRDSTVRSISSRFKEKPKLKRGQTVDSVFRIPLIPSSPLKHAQQHQQTPTAHLEEHVDLSITIEDDERSSPGAGSGDGGGGGNGAGGAGETSHDSPSLSLSRRNRPSSTRSRSGSTKAASSGRREPQVGVASPANPTPPPPTQQSSAKAQTSNDQDSSFEADDALDLMTNNNGNSTGNNRGAHATPTRYFPSQMVRQSSLSTLSSTITRTEQKRQRALWDLFQSECTFFFDHLMTLKNVYMEPLKKIQVEGFAMFADPDVLFGNLDELCCGVYDFCKEFLYIIMRTVRTRPEELNATDVLIKLYKKNPKIDHLRGVYHRYTLNYINALTYLESLRRQVEFVEFEKWSSRDVRCKKLQLTDLLVAPVQHIMRVPIILRDIESHTENPRDRDEIRAILAVEEASLRELDDKMRWLKNFERLLEIQKNISWPNVLELDPKLFIPDFLKEVLSKQPCEKLIVSPRRQIVHEGSLNNFDLGRACDMHVILFDDMLLLTRRKKGLTKKASTVGKTNSGGSSAKDDGSFKYIVYKQPLSLDRFYVHDVQQVDAQAIGMKHLFLLIVMNRFQQIMNVHSFSAPNDELKQTWLFKIKKTAERWKKNLSTSSGEQSQEQHVKPPTNTNPNTQHQSASDQKAAVAQQQQQHQMSTKTEPLTAAASN